jgi:hypothetical protein
LIPLFSLAIASIFACQAQESMPEMPEMTIMQAQEALTDSVMALPGVTGIGIGECEGAPCIKVMVAQATAELSAKIPTMFEGFPVVVEETGEIRALEDEP